MQGASEDLAAGTFENVAQNDTANIAPPQESSQNKGGVEVTVRQKSDLSPSVSPAPSAAFGKVGRNDPCPCGSGKKYKKCHGK